MIMGAGGACRSIAIELSSQGANSIDIRNRSLKGPRNSRFYKWQL